MAYVMTYDSLLTDVRNYLDRGSVNDPSLYAQLPHLVAMAEKRIEREIKPQGFEAYVTGNLTANQYVYVKPNLWRETKSLTIGTGTNYNTRIILYPREWEWLVTEFAPDATATGTPRYYAEYGYSHIQIAATPDAAYPFEWAYFQLLQPLDTTTQTNWLTQYAPNLLLYAVLLECAPFLKASAPLATWQAMYQDAAQKLMGEDMRKIGDQSNARAG